MTTAPGLNETPGFTGPSEPRPVMQPLYRSGSNRVLAGVCGGIAHHYRADPTAVRLLAAIIALITGFVPMIVLYLIAAVVIPERVDGNDAEPSTNSRVVAPGRGGLLVGIVLVAVGFSALANEVFRVDWDVLWPVALIVVGGALALMAWRR